MAFIFVPNADGSFTEGDKQTNPDTGVEYIYSDGAWRALGPKIEDEFDTLDNRYIKLTGTSTTTGAYTLKGDNQTSDGTSTFQRISGGEQKLYHIATPEDSNTDWVANVQYVKDYVDDKLEDVDLDNLDNRYLKLSGGTLTGQVVSNRDSGAALRVQKDGVNTASIWTSGAFETEKTSFTDKQLVPKWFMDVNIRGAVESYLPLTGGTLTNSLVFNRGNKASHQFGIEPNSSTPDTNIHSFQDGQIRFRTTHTDDAADRVGSHIVLDPNGGSPETKIYNVVTPTNGAMAVNKDYVDEVILDLLEGGLPDPPAGEPAPPSVIKPAFLAWEWDGESSDVSSPNSGHFYRQSANSAGNTYLRLSFNSKNGVKIGDGKFADTNMGWAEYQTHCSIWEWITTNNKNSWKLKRNFSVDATRWNYKPTGEDSAHLELKISNSYQMGHPWSSLQVGFTYYITVGGLF